MNTLKKWLEQELTQQGETLTDVETTNCNPDWFELRWNIYDLPEGSKKIFWWSRSRVYFLTDYDGEYYIDSVPRNPPART